MTNVVLPSGYASRKCWPVMYLLHGTAVPDQPYPVSLQWLEIEDGDSEDEHPGDPGVPGQRRHLVGQQLVGWLRHPA